MYWVSLCIFKFSIYETFTVFFFQCLGNIYLSKQKQMMMFHDNVFVSLET